MLAKAIGGPYDGLEFDVDHSDSLAQQNGCFVKTFHMIRPIGTSKTIEIYALDVCAFERVTFMWMGTIATRKDDGSLRESVQKISDHLHSKE